MKNVDLAQIQRKRNEAFNKGALAAMEKQPRQPQRHELPLSWAQGYDYAVQAGLVPKKD